MQSIDRLVALSRSFGASAAREKPDLLDTIAATPRISATGLRALHDCLCFMHAYPDNARVLRGVDTLIAQLRSRVAALPDGEETRGIADVGFPGGINRHVFSYPTVRRALDAFPGCFEVELESMEDDAPLHYALALFVTNNECQGLDDIDQKLARWIDLSMPSGVSSRLEFIVGVFEGSSLGPEERAHIYDGCGIPIRYRLALAGTGRAELCRPPRRVHYQRGEISHPRRELEREIRRPLGKLPLLRRSDAEQIIHLAHAALSSRCLEIAPLMYADPGDVTLIDCASGLQVALVGVVPEYRDTLESVYFFLILKNGVPIAYGPAGVCLGCCEMGINLFPEFRGAEIRTIYAQFMRCLHQALGVRYFYLTSYGMGVENPEAIRTGAFWFYRKLGFRADNPAVEALARSEEAQMRRKPGYRSDARMLRRLSRTNVYFDISNGECTPLPLGRIGIRQSRFIGETFDGNRQAALQTCTSRIRRYLEITDFRSWSAAAQRALQLYSPLLCMFDDLEAWSRRDRARMLRIIENKAARSERAVDGLAFAHARFRKSLWALD